MNPADVSAVLVTRGHEDLTEIYESLAAAGVTDVVTWDNSKRRNVSCYGRYLGIAEAKHDYIYHQDDDLVAPVADIIAAYDPIEDADTIVANNRADETWLLTAMGVVFHRSLADCFQPYIDAYGEDADFYRVSDVVFAYQHPYRRITLGYRDLPWASDPNASMYLEVGHYVARECAVENLASLEAVKA